MSVLEFLLFTVIVIAIGALFFWTLFAFGRVMPIVIGLLILGVAAAMAMLPFAFGLLPECGYLFEPRFVDPAGVTPGSMAQRCMDSHDVLGIGFVETALVGVGSILVGIYRTIGLPRTLIIVLSTGLLIGVVTIVPEQGIVSALEVVAIFVMCIVAALTLTRRLGRLHRGLAVGIWAVTLGLGVYLATGEIGGRAVFFVVILVVAVAMAAIGLMVEESDRKQEWALERRGSDRPEP